MGLFSFLKNSVQLGWGHVRFFPKGFTKHTQEKLFALVFGFFFLFGLLLWVGFFCLVFVCLFVFGLGFSVVVVFLVLIPVPMQKRIND